MESIIDQSAHRTGSNHESGVGSAPKVRPGEARPSKDEVEGGTKAPMIPAVISAAPYSYGGTSDPDTNPRKSSEAPRSDLAGAGSELSPSSRQSLRAAGAWSSPDISGRLFASQSLAVESAVERAAQREGKVVKLSHSDPARPYCAYCQKAGHTIEQCRKRKPAGGSGGKKKVPRPHPRKGGVKGGSKKENLVAAALVEELQAATGNADAVLALEREAAADQRERDAEERVEKEQKERQALADELVPPDEIIVEGLKVVIPVAALSWAALGITTVFLMVALLLAAAYAVGHEQLSYSLIAGAILCLSVGIAITVQYLRRSRVQKPVVMLRVSLVRWSRDTTDLIDDKDARGYDMRAGKRRFRPALARYKVDIPDPRNRYSCCSVDRAIVYEVEVAWELVATILGPRVVTSYRDDVEVVQKRMENLSRNFSELNLSRETAAVLAVVPTSVSLASLIYAKRVVEHAQKTTTPW